MPASSVPERLAAAGAAAVVAVVAKFGAGAHGFGEAVVPEDGAAGNANYAFYYAGVVGMTPDGAAERASIRVEVQ